ncbi:alkyl sulfatase dimerization domain-containing protein [Alcanivorax profundi]|uniref:alkyl sulfatase dimerization domain-containing protein n=1 Tax=Alcanivorax profundi TaxID=2338368 RepID=UPI002E862582|nr:alkyl sulfatase dimerization domain-containing protein [Pseudomonadota bacterium]|tara:strand:- start:99 stop:1802 length:1704 start_codon:yes stop_codon:yes gene_type:complete
MRYLFVVFAALLAACGEEPLPTSTTQLAPEALKAHSDLFRKGVEKVTDGVYVAIGYGLANSIMLEGDDGIIIVDTMETEEEAREVLAAFRTLTDKPVKAIIYTHNHTDHVFGAAAFAEGNDIPVYAHESTSYYINRVVNQIRPIITARSMRMFGNHLPHGEHINDGIGPHLGITPDSQLYALPPTHTFKDSLSVNIAGLQIELVHAPGETEDQLFVWLPEKRTALTGDNIYQTFPNLYTIRGTYYRDVKQWANSLDTIRELGAEHLVPSHTRPVHGADKVAQLLTDYSDAINFVHDQTLRYMNLGLTPDQIVEKVHLPEHLASNPWLQEFYGKVSWSVRSVFDGYLGWFSGNPSELQPLAEEEEARRMAELAGGRDALLDKARQALANQDAQWALDLSDHLMLLKPDDNVVKTLRADALRQLGEKEANPNARNYYFTVAREVADGLNPAFRTQMSEDFLATLPIENFLQAMPALLKAEDTLDENVALGYAFRDSNKQFTLRIRRGVAKVHTGIDDDVVATLDTTEATWKAIAAGIQNPATALAGEALDIDGSTLSAMKVLGYFEKID